MDYNKMAFCKYGQGLVLFSFFPHLEVDESAMHT
jgi:hypothetical protein